MVDSVVQRRCRDPAVHIEIFGRHVGKLGGVVPGAYRDVSLHAFHLRQLAFVDEFGLFPAAAHQDLARDLRVAYLSERHAAFFVNVADYLLHERFAAVAFVRNEHFFTFLDSAGIADEQVSQFFDSWIHYFLPIYVNFVNFYSYCTLNVVFLKG